MIKTILLLLIYVLTPAGMLWLCNKVKFLGKIGPILLLYILGVIIGNLPWINDGTAGLKDTITTVMIPLAIPMMLFRCSISKSDLKGIFKSLIAGLIAILVSILCGYAIFGKYLGVEGPKIAAMLTGCETGGTINMAALQQALHVPSETFIMMNSYDMIICFLYFVFLLSIGIKWFRKVLPHKQVEYTDAEDQEVKAQIAKDNMVNPYRELWSKSGILQILKIIAAVAIVCALGYVCTIPFPKTWFTPIFIMAITTFSLIASFVKPVKKLEKSFDIGMYLIYIFSIAMASMADVRNLNFQEGLAAFLFLFFIIFVSLFVQLIISKLLKVDSDMMVASSVSLINSPPFVPVVVTAMKNKNVLVPGITIGLIGFALGNYLGMGIYQLLQLF
ncbi:MAG: DUF819 family protein [Bacteroidales bacterium]|nr:DUF819 family protein [Bacteroidales bacterium]